MATQQGNAQQPAAIASGIRRIVLDQSYRAHVGHIGSALSVAEVVAAVWSQLAAQGPDDPQRDRFILAKGHAALALYAALYLRGWVSADQLSTFCGDDSLLGVHPECQLSGVDFATGSLGQGLSMGVGAALAARWQGSPRRVFVVLSDGECNEGAVWEAAMVAAHQRLANLIAIIDVNGQQALGYTREVLALPAMAERWRDFGWDAHEVDGHNADALAATLAALDTGLGAPHVLLARTVLGKGVSYMEGQIKWHYWPMDADEYATALGELETTG